MRTEDLSQREPHPYSRETARGEKPTMSEKKKKKKNDETEDIRIERFIDDGEGLIITYPNNKETPQPQDEESSN